MRPVRIYIRITAVASQITQSNLKDLLKVGITILILVIARRKHRSTSKRSADLGGQHSSKEFILLGSHERLGKQRQIELQEELYDTRTQLNHYKQIVYDMKRQLDKASE